MRGSACGSTPEPSSNGMRFIGGMRYTATGGAFSGGTNFTWPLAVLEVREESVFVSPRGIFKTWWPAVEMPVTKIIEVDTNFGLSKNGLRFRVHGQGDGTVFWAGKKK